jgi:3-dehydroquinate dehydratase / shikimate dehydrogenase
MLLFGRMRQRMLAVAFGPRSMAAACEGLPRIREVADCVELRLDLFEEAFELPTLMRARRGLPVVVTLRPPSQGGRCPLPPGERLAVLLRAAELGAEYVDVEFDAVSDAGLQALRAAGTRVIVSRHDFAAMPDLADDWYPRLVDLGADVVKVVGTARDVRDCLVVLRALAKATQPTIAIGMGEAGLPSRVLALRSDQCLLTYASLADGAGTAPGQITVSDMRSVYRSERVGPGTRVFGLLGSHAERERLREYNEWFAASGTNAVAVPFPAASEAAAIVAAFRQLPVDGWHIHGEALQRDAPGVLDDLSARARAQQKVNGIVRRADGSLVGHWVESPREQYEVWLAAS